MAGKGDDFRPTDGDKFRDNYDRIRWSKKPKTCKRCSYFVRHSRGRIRCVDCGKVIVGQIAIGANIKTN